MELIKPIRKLKRPRGKKFPKNLLLIKYNGSKRSIPINKLDKKENFRIVP
jgi:hypothetical protein